MEETLNHIIKTEHFDVQVNQKDQVAELQDRISHLQENGLSEAIESILDHYSLPDELVRFDQVHLNLGKINPHNFENEVIIKVQEELIRFLSSNILENGTVRNGKKTILNHRRLELFEFFLLKGYLPWNLTASETPKKLLSDLLSEEKPDLIDSLNILGKKAYVRRRLILQFDDDTLDQVVYAVAGGDGKYIVGYKNEMFEHQRQEHFVESNFTYFRNSVWEVILAYLFLETKSYYSRKSFLEYLIGKVARKYNITYSLLLHALSKGLESEDHELKRDIEFRKIVLELKVKDEIAQLDIEKKFATEKHFEHADSPNLLSITELFSHFTLYGSQPARSPYRSEKELTDAMLKFLKTQKEEGAKYFEMVLTDREHRSGLIRHLSPASLNQVIRAIPNKQIKDLVSFLDQIIDIALQLPGEFSRLSTDLAAKMGTLSIKAYVKSTGSQKRTLLQKLLVAIVEEIPAEKQQLKFLILQVKKGFKKDTHVAFDQVMGHFFPDEGESTSDHDIEKKPILQPEVIRSLDSGIMALIREFEKIEGLAHKKTIEQQLELLLKQIKSGSKVDLVGMINHLKKEGIGKKHLQLIETSLRKLLSEGQSKHVAGTLNKVNPQPDHNELRILGRRLNIILTSTDTIANSRDQLFKQLKLAATTYAIPVEVLVKNLLAELNDDPEYQLLRNILMEVSDDLSFTTSLPSANDELSNVFQLDLIRHYARSGKLPWWAKGLTKNKLQKLINRVWDTSSKELISILKTEPSGYLLGEYFTETNFLALLSGVDRSKDKSFRRTYELYRKLIKDGGLWTSEVGLSISSLRRKILRPLLNGGSTPNFISLWEELLREVSHSTSTGAKEMVMLFYHELNIEKTKNTHSPIHRWIIEKKRISEMNVSSVNIDQDLKQLLFEAVQSDTTIRSTSSSIYEQLETIQSTNPELLKDWLKNKAVRTNLIQLLSEKEMTAFARSTLNPSQRKEMESVLILFKTFKKHLSLTQYKAFWEHFSDSFLLMTAMGKSSHIQEKTWIDILFSGMHRSLQRETISGLIIQLINEPALKSAGIDLPRTFLQEAQSRMEVSDLPETINSTNEERYFDETELVEKIDDESEKFEEEELGDSIFVNNAGLVLLTPFIPTLFERLGFIDSGKFSNSSSESKAVHLLQYLCSGIMEAGEHEMVLNKILCGLELGKPIEKKVELTDEDRAIADGLLEAVIQQWSIIKNTSIDGLRESFLMRDGKIIIGEDYELRVEQKSYDMLLDQVPWGFNRVKFSWMNKMISVAWR